MNVSAAATSSPGLRWTKVYFLSMVLRAGTVIIWKVGSCRLGPDSLVRAPQPQVGLRKSLWLLGGAFTVTKAFDIL